MTNAPLRFSMAIVLAAFCLLLVGGSGPQDLDARRQHVEQMTSSEKARLYRRWERFHALPPQRQENLRQLEQQISKDKHADELKEVMRRYYQWCRNLPAYQRLELLELPIQERIAKIEELKLQPEDVAGLKKWFEAKALHITDHLSVEQKKHLPKIGNRWLLLWWMNGMTKKSGPGGNNPLNDQDLANLRSHLSEPTQKILEQKTSSQQWKSIVERFRRHFRPQNYRRHSRRRQGIPPAGISNEDLAAAFQNLPPQRQDKLLSLPAEEMLQQLQQIYMNHRSPKFHPKKPNNRNYPFQPDKKRGFNPHPKASKTTTRPSFP